jgi:pimeloyl-ACP methyl ester carboxylesterase
MSLEEYCDIRPDMAPLEKQLRYACGLVPELAHIAYFDVSAGRSNTDFISGTGPSLASACALASALVATEAVLILLGRRAPRGIPYSFQFDPYTFRYEQSWIPGGMANYDPEPAIARIPDRSSLVPQVLDLFYRKRKSRKARVNGAELYYKVEGNGEPVILISPLGADCGFWARQTQDLARHFRVISFDNRGSGASRASSPECSTALMAQDAIALLHHLGIDRCHVVGLALGALVAQQLAVERPDLVSGLVLASTYSHADDRLQSITAEWRRMAMDDGMAVLFDHCVPFLFSEAYVADSGGELSKLKTFFRLTLQEPVSFCSQSLAGVSHDLRHRLGEIHAPTVVIHGGADRLIALGQAEEVASAIPGARLLVLPGAPHFLTWEHAERFNQDVRDFLGALELARVSS